MQFFPLVFSCLFFSSFSDFQNAAVVPGSANRATDSDLKTDMLEAVNDLRMSGCRCGDRWMPATTPLAWNDRLAKAAFRHTKDMAANRRFSHFGSDGSNPAKRADAAGYNWKAIGENIAMNQTSVDEVMEDWQKSPGHCRNMMNPKYREMGAARVGKYWAQEFGKPL